MELPEKIPGSLIIKGRVIYSQKQLSVPVEQKIKEKIPLSSCKDSHFIGSIDSRNLNDYGP